MSPKKKRPIPSVNPKDYASQGHIIIQPSATGKEVHVEVHHCSVMMSENEALHFLLSLLSASFKTWGSTFVRKFLTYAEKI